LLVALCLPAHGAGPKEYQVKAAFLFNFAKFVDWPAERFDAADAPIVIAVLGRNPFDDELKNLVHERIIDGRPVIIRLLPTVAVAKASLPTVHILFVPAGEESRFADLIDAARPVGVLTVGESPRFAALGGIVTFFVGEERLRFEINRPAAEGAGVKVRAQLHKLAAPGRRSSP
jgi:hypothetical protein